MEDEKDGERDQASCQAGHERFYRFSTNQVQLGDDLGDELGAA